MKSHSKDRPGPFLCEQANVIYSLKNDSSPKRLDADCPSSEHKLLGLPM